MEALRKTSPDSEPQIPNPNFANDNGKEAQEIVKKSANDNERVLITPQSLGESPVAVNDNTDHQLEVVTSFEQESSDKERISQIKERLGANSEMPVIVQEGEITAAREHTNAESAEHAGATASAASGAAGGTTDGGSGDGGGSNKKEKGGGSSSHGSSDEKGSGWLMKILKFGFIVAGFGIMAVKKLTEKALDWSGANKGGGGGGAAKKPSGGGHGGGHL